MRIYIDRVFLLNLAVDYLLLLAAARLAGIPLRRLRLLLCAAGGGLYVAVVFLPGLGWLAHPVGKVVSGAAMALAAFAPERSRWRLIGLFFLLSGALAGIILAAGFCVGAPGLLLGRIYRAEIDWRLLLGGTAALSTVLHLLFRQGARHGGGELMTVQVAIGGHVRKLTALHDTGNTLRDPVNGRPVLVAEQAAVLELLPERDAAILRENSAPEAAMARLYDGGSRLHFTLLPFRSVGTESGLLLAVRSDYIALHRRRMPRTLIALSPGPVSDGGGYCALWGGAMERGENTEEADTADLAQSSASGQAG